MASIAPSTTPNVRRKGENKRASARASAATKKEQSAAAILETAKGVFVKNGYLETNLGVVAKKLKMTRQAIYHYFPAKHDILTQIFDIYFEGLDEIVRENRAEKQPGERFNDILKAYFEFIMEHRAEAMLMARELAHLPPAQQKRIKGRRRKINDVFIQEFTAGQEAGLFKEGPARIYVAMIIGAANWTTRWFRKDGDYNAAELATVAQDLLSSGYAPGRKKKTK